MKAFSAALGSLALAASAVAQTPAPDGALPGEIVVMLQTGASVHDIARRHRLTVLDQFGQRPIWRLKQTLDNDTTRTLASLRRDSRIRFAEPNVIGQTPERRHLLVWAIGSGSGSWAAQWAPQALALPQAHQLSTGTGVRVAVLDSGADLAHPQLAGRWARDAAGRLLGRDFVDADADPSEGGSAGDAGWGHGTHVAGLVALAAPGATLLPARVLDASGRGNLWVVAEALMWALDPDGNPATDDGAHVVNLSLGTTRPTRLLNTAIELATCSDDDDNEDDDDYSDPGFDADRARCDLRGGAVVVAAAGNGGSGTELQYPAAEGAEGQLAIAATQADGRLAPFANRGTWVQLSAPGDQIVSTLPGGGWATWSGTSMAAPLAAGVAALVRARQPDWKAVDVTKRLQDRSVAGCGTSIRALHAHGAVADFVPPDPACR
ncbi:S8 family serine peptidase [Ideonella sp. A 288]|uniref:S8 family serine peptidase n=1 Tax=Ideonella sp. A 288 TaxID=1962181 RepID=UPI001185F9AB|nr:S8 family serine peptidase [Ideonella sp. A 288]